MRKGKRSTLEFRNNLSNPNCNSDIRRQPFAVQDIYLGVQYGSKLLRYLILGMHVSPHQSERDSVPDESSQRQNLISHLRFSPSMRHTYAPNTLAVVIQTFAPHNNFQVPAGYFQAEIFSPSIETRGFQTPLRWYRCGTGHSASPRRHHRIDT